MGVQGMRRNGVIIMAEEDKAKKEKKEVEWFVDWDKEYDYF